MAENASAYLNLRLKGRYLIEHHIGSGLSAHAFRAYDTLLQGRVVVKIIKNEIAGVPIDLGEEWKSESLKAMQVRGHPHIASILDLGEEKVCVDNLEENIHFIVSEYVEGRTLKELETLQVSLDVQELLTIAHQLFTTLDYLQARKLSHDDLHSGNIMVSQLGAGRPFIKIIDFGMATNTIIPRSREKDVHFALVQLDALCRKSLSASCDSLARSVLENFSALLKKGKSFISTGRMRLSDFIAEIETLQQELASGRTNSPKVSVASQGPRSRIDIQRRTPFVGRKNEVERLYLITHGSFLARRGAVLLISGEAGIGKTRLVDEILGRVAAERTRHLLFYHKSTDQAIRQPLGTLFHAIIDLLDDIPGDDDTNRLEVLLGQSSSLIKPLAQIIADQRLTLLGNSPENQDSVELSTVPFLLVSFFIEVSLTTPVVIFLDDLHLADTATIEFLNLLSSRIQESPIVVYATFRPEDISQLQDNRLHPLQVFLGDIIRRDTVRLVELGGLDRDEMDEIISTLNTFAQPGDFSKLSDIIRQMAGGNPYFLFEIIELMQDEGYLIKRADSHWVIEGDLKKFSVPASINGLVERRLERLSLNEIQLLRSAALQGYVFNTSILERMFLPCDQKLTDILQNLTRKHGLIRLREEGYYAFCNQLVHQAILRAMATDDIKRGHSEVARLLEKTAVENQNPIPHHLIAHHLAFAGQHREAAEHYLAAGKRALEAQQYHLAIEQLREAADLLNLDEPDDLALDVILGILECVKPQGERDLHQRAVHYLKHMAEALNRPGLQLKAMLEECIYLRTISEHEKSLAIAEEIIRLARENEDNTIEAIALKEAGTAYYLMGRMEKAEEYFHEAAGILASIGDRSQLARVYNNLGLVCRNSRRHEEMILYFNRALEIFRNEGDTIGERFPLGNLGIVYFERGEFERAYECFCALKASLAVRADLMMEGKVDYSIGEIFLEVGLFNEARESCERALQIFLTIGNRQGESEVLGTLGGIHLAMGDIQLAREYFERSLQVKIEIGNAVGMLHSEITLARIANLEGRHSEALKTAEEVLEKARKRSLRNLELEALTEIMVAKTQMNGPLEALQVLSPSEEPEQLDVSISPALITFAYKAGEFAFQAGDETRALQYIAISGKSIETILHGIKNPEWHKAYAKKREQILETYHRLQPAIKTHSSSK